MQTGAAHYQHGHPPSTSWSPSAQERIYSPHEPFQSPPPAHDESARRASRQGQFLISPTLTPDTALSEARLSPSDQQGSLGNVFGNNTADNTNGNANGNGKAKFVCTKKPGCNKTFPFKSLQEKHEATHLKPFVCTYCKNVKKSFASKTDLQRHINNVHFSCPSSAFSYRCKYDACANRQRIILRLDNFKTHLKRKHKKPEEPDSDDFYSRAEKECRIYREPTSAPVEIPHEQLREEISKAHAFLCDVPSCSGNNVGFATEDELRRHRHVEHESGDSPAPEGEPSNSQSRASVPARITLPPPSDNNWPMGDYQLSPLNIPNNQQTHSRQEVATILAGMRDPARLGESSRDAVSVDSDEESQNGRPARRSTLPSMSTALRQSNGKRQGEDGLDPKTAKRSKTIPVSGKSDQNARAKRIECEICQASFHQHRDLKKHKIRHERPFFCTYDGCDGTFGSKNDWIRHEKSQHFKLESWKCPFTNPEATSGDTKQYFNVRCRTRFFRREGLREHIRRWHTEHLSELYRIVEPTATEIPDSDNQLKAIVDKSFNSSNPSETFWCGFCRKTKNFGKGNGSRYDHIGNHFDEMIKKSAASKLKWHRMESTHAGINPGAPDPFLTEAPPAEPRHFEAMTG